MTDHTLDVLAWAMVFAAAALTAGLFSIAAGALMLVAGLEWRYTVIYTILAGAVVYCLFWLVVLTFNYLGQRADRVEL